VAFIDDDQADKPGGVLPVEEGTCLEHGDCLVGRDTS
jgi:hypothetical protein